MSDTVIYLGNERGGWTGWPVRPTDADRLGSGDLVVIGQDVLEVRDRLIPVAYTTHSYGLILSPPSTLSVRNVHMTEASQKWNKVTGRTIRCPHAVISGFAPGSHVLTKDSVLTIHADGDKPTEVLPIPERVDTKAAGGMANTRLTFVLARAGYAQAEPGRTGFWWIDQPDGTQLSRLRKLSAAERTELLSRFGATK